jgi:radical SAM protein with 4Fe4S-binding SPASM domain
LWKVGLRRALPDLPSTLMVEPTNACNLRCPACPVGTGRLNRPTRAMSLDEFRSILDQALAPPLYLRQVTLFNYGEPFLCPDFLAMVRYAAGRGLAVMTSTNGHFFATDEAAAGVVESGLAELIVCLDGGDQETMARYRRNADFDQIIEGIRRVLLARRTRRAATPKVELQFIVMRHNESQLPAMRRLAEDLGVDRFIEKTVGIPATHPDFQSLARDLLPSDLSRSRYQRLDDGTYVIAGTPPSLCEYVYSTMVINSNGDVVPCCYDGESQHVMGNVFRQPLKEVWRGAAFQRFRRLVRESSNAIPICRGCPEGRVTMRRVEDVAGRPTVGPSS